MISHPYDNKGAIKESQNLPVPPLVPFPTAEELANPPLFRHEESSGTTLPFPDLEIERLSGGTRIRLLGTSEERMAKRASAMRLKHKAENLKGFKFPDPFVDEETAYYEEYVPKSYDSEIPDLDEKLREEVDRLGIEKALSDTTLPSDMREFFLSFPKSVLIAKYLLIHNQRHSGPEGYHYNRDEAVDVLEELWERLDTYAHENRQRKEIFIKAHGFVMRALTEKTTEELREGLIACHYYLSSGPMIQRTEIQLIDAIYSCFDQHLYRVLLPHLATTDENDCLYVVEREIFKGLKICRSDASHMYILLDRICGLILDAMRETQKEVDIAVEGKNAAQMAKAIRESLLERETQKWPILLSQRRRENTV